MSKGKRNRTRDLITELIQNELEANLAKMVRRTREKANREAGKLNNMLRLEYHKGHGFVDAEVIDDSHQGEEVKKTGDPPDGEGQ